MEKGLVYSFFGMGYGFLVYLMSKLNTMLELVLISSYTALLLVITHYLRKKMTRDEEIVGVIALIVAFFLSGAVFTLF